MWNLSVSIEKNGKQVRVGSICGSVTEDAVFSYDEEYLSDKTAVPISVSLPLQTDVFSPAQTKCFFEGLLPEGFTRRAVAQRLRADADDYLAILSKLGNECIGAIRITDQTDTLDIPSYEPVRDSDLYTLSHEDAAEATHFLTGTRLSLAGASGKVGLYYDTATKQWFLPKGTAPSTHIVKQSHVRLQSIVTNEQLCMLTASRLGIKVPDSFIVDVDHDGDRNLLFATRRFDRVFADDAVSLNGLNVPRRLHQEDFAQALGISSGNKYERPGEEHMKKMFSLIRDVSENPIEDQLALWDMLVFDYLIGNTDCHVKNFSLLYSSNINAPRLAPAYDIVSTRIYESCSKEMAFAIGGESDIERITRDSFEAAASEVGIGRRLATQRFDSMSDRFEKELTAAASELQSLGFTRSSEICERILRHSCI